MAAVISYNISDSAAELSVVGHAAYGPPGANIVCASVSLLLQTLIYTVEGFPDLDVGYVVAEGASRVSCTFTDRGTASMVMAAFETVMCGYELLARKFPSEVHIEKAGD